MVTMAGNAAEVDSKMQVVFGKELPGLKKNLDAFADATGASSFKLREQAADMGALLGPLVGTKKGAADMSEQFVKLATDLGSFNNVPVEEALLAIRSGLVGESEPLRRFGVLLNEAAVKSEALRMGLVKGKEELTEQQKVMARASLIMQQTTQAQNDATRTAGSYANQIKALKNTVTDLATGFGMRLLPAATAVAGGLNTFINKISEADGAGAKFRVVIDTIVRIAKAAGSKIVDAFKAIDWSATWDGLVTSAKDIGKKVSAALSATMASIDWKATGTAIIDGITTALDKADELATALKDVVMRAAGEIDWAALGKTMGPALLTAIATAVTLAFDPAFWAQNWELMVAAAIVTMPGRVLKIGLVLGKALFNVAGIAVKEMAVGFRSAFPAIDDAVSAIIPRILGFLKGLPGQVSSLFRQAGQAIGQLAGDWVRIALSLATGAAGAVIRGLARLAPGVSSAVTAGLAAIRNAAASWAAAAVMLGARVITGILTKLGTLPSLVSGKLMEAANAVRALVDVFLSAAADVGIAIGRGILNGIASMAGAIAAKAKEVVQRAIDTAKRLLHIDSPSKVFFEIGENTIRGFILGITAEQPALEGKMAEATQKALDKARATVEKFQGAFGEAFSKLGDFAKRAFDAKTASLLEALDRKFDAKIAKWQAFGDALTPAEKAIAQLDEAEQKRSRASALAAAEEQMAKAQALTDETERATAIIAAQEALRVAQLSITRAKLEETAQVERAARDLAVAEHIAALEATKAREAQNLEERRSQLGAKLDEQLATLAARLAKHPEEYDKIQKQINALLASYGVPMQKAGENLGKAFARGIRNSIDDAVAAAKALAKAVAQYLPHSPAEKGALSKPINWAGYITAGLPETASALSAATARLAGAAVMPRLTGGGYTAGPAMAGAAAMGGVRAGGGNTYNIYASTTYGDERSVNELVRKIRTDLLRTAARN